jgi:hypothetical protein
MGTMKHSRSSTLLGKARDQSRRDHRNSILDKLPCSLLAAREECRGGLVTRGVHAIFGVGVVTIMCAMNRMMVHAVLDLVVVEENVIPQDQWVKAEISASIDGALVWFPAPVWPDTFDAQPQDKKFPPTHRLLRRSDAGHTEPHSRG